MGGGKEGGKSRTGKGVRYGMVGRTWKELVSFLSRRTCFFLCLELLSLRFTTDFETLTFSSSWEE